MRLTVCIPMYNESDTVDKCAVALYDKLCGLRERRGIGFEIIFSDDGSLDDCRAKAESFAEGKGEIRVIGERENHGKGFAVRRAMLAASGDAVLFTDCDLAYGVDVIEDAVDRIYKDGEFVSDIVIGSRNLEKDGYSGYGAIRKIASKAYIKALSLVGGYGLSDSQCGFKVFRTDAAAKIFSLCECDGFAFDYEVILIAKHLGMKVSEMPVRIVNHRESSVHVVRDSFSMFKDMLKIKRRVSKL